MNGLRTRNHFHAAFRASTARERAGRAARIDSIIARLCGLGLIVLIVLQLAERVAA